MDVEYVTVDAYVVGQTEKAVKLQIPDWDVDEAHIWVPKSVIEDVESVLEELGGDESVDVEIAAWWARKNDLD